MSTEPLPRLLPTRDAARLLGLGASTLEKHRVYGTGPVYRKLGGRIVYAAEDLISWAEKGARLSTSDRLASIVSPPKPSDQAPLGRKGRAR